MSHLSPLISWPYPTIDPNAAKWGRHEKRLALLRQVIANAQNASDLLLKRVEYVLRILKNYKMCVLAPQTRTLSAKGADAGFGLANQVLELRSFCIPIKSTANLALNVPIGFRPPVQLKIQMEANPQDDIDQILVSQSTDKSVVELLVRETGGRELKISIVIGPFPPNAMADLFAPEPDPSHSSSEPSNSSSEPRLSLPLPSKHFQTSLPPIVMLAIAEFWQKEIRAHVLASVCSPRGARRPISFDSMSLMPPKELAPCRLTAIAHPSSITCACALHKGGSQSQTAQKAAQTAAQQAAVPAQVEFTLTFCGRILKRSKSGILQDCRLHGNKTPVLEGVEVCTHGMHASMLCVHQTKEGKRNVALSLNSIAMPTMVFRQAQELGALAVESFFALKQAVAQNKDAVKKVCEFYDQKVNNILDVLDARKAEHGFAKSESDMLMRDAQAVECLLKGTLRRHIRPSTREEVLAIEGDRGVWRPVTKGDVKKGKVPSSDLHSTHLGLFPPAPRGSKRKRNS